MFVLMVLYASVAVKESFFLSTAATDSAFLVMLFTVSASSLNFIQVGHGSKHGKALSDEFFFTLDFGVESLNKIDDILYLSPDYAYL